MLSYVIVSSALVGFISFVGVFLLSVKKSLLQRMLFALVAFAAGTMLGNVFFHILPEAVHEQEPVIVGVLIMVGFSAFFIIERFLHWHHHHEPGHVHPFGYLNLIGDGVHNLLDGVLIGASYVISPVAGAASTVAIIAHEIPQEIGDFGILLHAGFSRTKALVLNFVSALFAVAGALAGWFFLDGESVHLVLPLVAGSLLYVGASDLIPELHKEGKVSNSFVALICFLVGLGVMYLLSVSFAYIH